MPKVSKTQIDKDEKTILAELQQNGKSGIDAIAKKYGFSRQKVWRIIKRLEQTHLIWGYTAIVDDKKNNMSHYTLLIKRTTQQLFEKTVNIIASRKIEEAVTDIGITVESSYYVNGEYDWVLTFIAPNLIVAKKFCELLNTLHPGVIEKMNLLETLFMVKNHYILSPDPKKLKEYI